LILRLRFLKKIRQTSSKSVGQKIESMILANKMQLYSRPKTRPTTVINGKSLKSVTQVVRLISFESDFPDFSPVIQIRAKTEATSGAEVKEVEKVNGVRICQSRVGNPILQFLVKLKDNDNENIW
jgi:hypothetical protein